MQNFETMKAVEPAAEPKKDEKPKVEVGQYKWIDPATGILNVVDTEKEMIDAKREAFENKD
ncbi:MAG: hypothetical protein ACOYL8_03405 [Patescibacteria group bacterium]